MGCRFNSYWGLRNTHQVCRQDKPQDSSSHGSPGPLRTPKDSASSSSSSSHPPNFCPQILSGVHLGLPPALDSPRIKAHCGPLVRRLPPPLSFQPPSLRKTNPWHTACITHFLLVVSRRIFHYSKKAVRAGSHCASCLDFSPVDIDKGPWALQGARPLTCIPTMPGRLFCKAKQNRPHQYARMCFHHLQSVEERNISNNAVVGRWLGFLFYPQIVIKILFLF